VERSLQRLGEEFEGVDDEAGEIADVALKSADSELPSRGDPRSRLMAASIREEAQTMVLAPLFESWC
jgi:hypothetical protein